MKTNVLPFPRRPGRSRVAPPPVSPSASVAPPVAPVAPTLQKAPSSWFKRLARALACIVWMVVALLSTPIQWVVSAWTFIQGIRALWYWNESDVHAGWAFIAGFALLVTLQLFLTWWPFEGEPPKRNFSS